MQIGERRQMRWPAMTSAGLCGSRGTSRRKLVVWSRGNRIVTGRSKAEAQTCSVEQNVGEQVAGVNARGLSLQALDEFATAFVSIVIIATAASKTTCIPINYLNYSSAIYRTIRPPGLHHPTLTRAYTGRRMTGSAANSANRRDKSLSIFPNMPMLLLSSC
jgi:hypothetical protein